MCTAVQSQCGGDVTAMSIFCVEWLCTRERWNPEVAIIFGVAARYRWAKVGSSHDDAHPDNSTLHTGAVRPHTGFAGSLFFMSPRSVEWRGREGGRVQSKFEFESRGEVRMKVRRAPQGAGQALPMTRSAMVLNMPPA
jgi:hypothetical protein